VLGDWVMSIVKSTLGGPVIPPLTLLEHPIHAINKEPPLNPTRDKNSFLSIIYLEFNVFTNTDVATFFMVGLPNESFVNAAVSKKRLKKDVMNVFSSSMRQVLAENVNAYQLIKD